MRNTRFGRLGAVGFATVATAVLATTTAASADIPGDTSCKGAYCTYPAISSTTLSLNQTYTLSAPVELSPPLVITFKDMVNGEGEWVIISDSPSWTQTRDGVVATVQWTPTVAGTHILAVEVRQTKPSGNTAFTYSPRTVTVDAM